MRMSSPRMGRSVVAAGEATTALGRSGTRGSIVQKKNRPGWGEGSSRCWASFLRPAGAILNDFDLTTSSTLGVEPATEIGVVQRGRVVQLHHASPTLQELRFRPLQEPVPRAKIQPHQRLLVQFAPVGRNNDLVEARRSPTRRWTPHSAGDRAAHPAATIRV